MVLLQCIFRLIIVNNLQSVLPPRRPTAATRIVLHSRLHRAVQVCFPGDAVNMLLLYFFEADVELS